MPRGPGKRSNYNLDYSRFDGVDGAQEVPEERSAQEAADDFSVALRNMPPELQEAYRLTMLSRSTGDEAAQQRANELVLQAVEKGGPEVRETFLKELSGHLPEGTLSGTDDVLAPVEGSSEPRSQESASSLARRIDTMKAQMEAGREATRKQLDALQQQQESLEKISSAEDFVNFMTKEGMAHEDLQRMLTGDPKHMEELVAKMLNKAADPGDGAAALAGAEQAIQSAEELHTRICGDSTRPAVGSEKVRSTVVPALPEVILPTHRLQYQKDIEGRYQEMELICELPGVSDMGCIVLDIAEKHLRLNTVDPAPKYAINAGPFPVLIEPSGAKAKFSKKRAELSVRVPAKA